MKQELKIRIHDKEAVKQTLLKNGAKFIKHAVSKYSYFHQPPGSVLKITENDDGICRTIIEQEGDQFKIVSNVPVDDIVLEMRLLESKYGIKKELNNARDFFGFGDFLISINQFSEAEVFLIIEGDNPSLETVKQLAEIETPEVIIDSFDNVVS